MRNRKRKSQALGKVKVDTFPGRYMHVSSIEIENHSGPRIFERPHLLAPAFHRETI